MNISQLHLNEQSSLTKMLPQYKNKQHKDGKQQHITLRRDCWMFAIMLGFVLVWIVLTIIAYAKGDTTQIMTPMNTKRSSCNPNYKNEGQNYILYSQLTSESICLKQCPNQLNTQEITQVMNYGSLTSFPCKNWNINQPLSSYHYSNGRVKYISQLVINRFCVPHMDYFIFMRGSSNSNFQYYINLIVKSIQQQSVLSTFYLDYINNWYFPLIFFIFSFIITIMICKLMPKYYHRIQKLSKIAIHVCLTVQAFIFLYNSGRMGNSAYKAPYLGFPTFDYSSNHFRYSILFFILEGIWIAIHIHLYKSKQIADAVTNLSFQLTQTDTIAKKYSTILSFIIGIVIIMTLWASANFYSRDVNNNSTTFDYYDHFSHSISWSFIHIYYYFIGILIIIFLIESNNLIHKCLYFQSIASFDPKKSFLTKMKYHGGRFIVHTLCSPIFKPVIRCINVFRNCIEDCFKLEYELKCIKTNRKTILQYFYYLFNTNGYLMQYITKQNIYQSQYNSLKFHMKYYEQHRYFKKGKLQFNCIRFAITLITGLHFHLIITFILSVRKDFVYSQLQYLLVVFIAYTVSGINLAYYSAPIDSCFYGYHFYRNNTKIYPIANDVNKKLIQNAMHDMIKPPVQVQQQENSQQRHVLQQPLPFSQPQPNQQ